MIGILSKLTFNVLSRIVGYLVCFSHDIDEFFSPQFKSSIVRDVLKEAFLQANLFSKLQNHLNDKAVASSTGLIKWNKFIVEKGYPICRDLMCDIFLEGQVARNNPNSSKIVYKKGTLREVWIELKFFIPTRYGSAANVGGIANDFLRLCYLTESAKKDVDIKRYLIVFVLRGKYKNTYKDIINYFGSAQTMVKLFLPVNNNCLLDFNKLLEENRTNANFIEKVKRTVSLLENKIDLGTINITRQVLTPNKSLSGYIFKINGFEKTGEIIDLSDEIKEFEKKRRGKKRKDLLEEIDRLKDLLE